MNVISMSDFIAVFGISSCSENIIGMFGFIAVFGD